MPRTRRVKMLAALAGAAALVMTATACSPDASVDVIPDTVIEGQLDQATVDQMQGIVERAMAATGSTAAVVGVWVPWAGSWVTALGTDGPGGAPASVDMSFPIANATRPMTCDVLYGMAADGRIALDDSIAKWAHGVPTLEDVTLEQLCDSTSGIGSYAPRLMGRWIANPERVWAPGELIAYGMGNKTGLVPGETYSDSDAGYALLAQALQKAADRPFDELLREYVFDPLEMNDTTLLLPLTPAPERLAGLYSANNAEGAVDCVAPLDVTKLSPTAGYAAAGVTSTVTDLGRYMRALAEGSRSYDDEHRFDNALPAFPDAPASRTAKGGAQLFGPMVGQFGSMPGSIMAAAAERSTGMTVVVMFNNSRAFSGLGVHVMRQLAAIASMIPGADGQTVEVGLPWTADEFAPLVDEAAVCPLP